MSSLMGNDKEKTKYLQTICGLFLTGELEKVIFLFWGKGSNGKSHLFNIILKILGKRFYTTVPKCVFIKSERGGIHEGAATPHLIPIIGARACMFFESGPKDRLNEELLKTLTGADQIPCRKNYGDQFTFRCFAKFGLVTQHKPEFTFTDLAMTDRLRYVPFEVRFVENPKLVNEVLKDADLAEKMLSEYLDDVFLWMVEGAKIYYEKGLVVPPSLKKGMKAYIAEQDPFGEFMKERLVLATETDKIKLSELLPVYNNWANDNDRDPISSKTLGSYVRMRGTPKKIKNALYLMGWAFAEPKQESNSS
jgi:putative DNA primase/helicase